MSFSKKDLDKLKNILSDDNKSRIANKEINKKLEHNSNSNNRANYINEPKKLFYSIIDNDMDINDINNSVKSLRDMEDESRRFYKNDTSSEKTNKSSKNRNKYLSKEDMLYDEFNYLLDE